MAGNVKRAGWDMHPVYEKGEDMRNWKKRTFALLLALGMIFGLALSEEEQVETVPVLELPEAKKGKFAELTVSEDPMLGPRGNKYIFSGKESPTGYADPSITVNIGKGRIHGTNFHYARVKIANPYQIRTMMSTETISEVKTVMGATLAKRVKAVVALNGVLEADKSSGGNVSFVHAPVMRQGVWLRPGATTSAEKIESWRNEETPDTLVINSSGDLVVLESDTWGNIYDQILAMGDDAVNVITFGPALVLNGEARYGYASMKISATKPAQRAAICQTGPLEYLLITSDSPESSNNKGLKLDQFVELIETYFPEVQTAYNLDGGTSATLVFRKGSETWAKINSPGGKKRQIRDIIYFADAWIPSK